MRRFALLILLALSILPSHPPAVLAQYAIPDCFVAAVNATVPQPEYAAARDQYYRELSGEWLAETGSLSAQALAAYSQTFCASLQVYDRGESEAGEREIEWVYTPVESWLSSSGNGTSGGQTSATTSTGSLSGTGSGASGGIRAGGETVKGEAAQAMPTATPSTPAPQGPAFGAVSYEVTFDRMPREWSLIDGDGEPVAPQIVNGSSGPMLRIKTAAVNTLFYLGTERLTDYTLVARARINNGMFVLTVRGDSDLCSGYDLVLDPAFDYVALQETDTDCESTELAVATASPVPLGEWFEARLDVSGSQITAAINNQRILSATDTTLTEGAPFFYIFPPEGDQASVDLAMVRIERLTAGRLPDPTPVAPATSGALTQYAAAPAQTVAELQARGLIPQDGRFLAQGETLTVSGEGAGFQGIANRTFAASFVMAATLQPAFTGSSKSGVESCTLIARINFDGDAAINELNAGIEGGNVVLYDLVGPVEDALADVSAPLPGNTNAPVHALLIGDGDRASLYINGELTFENVTVEARAGRFGVGLIGTSANSQCVGSDVWVYSFD